MKRDSNFPSQPERTEFSQPNYVPNTRFLIESEAWDAILSNNNKTRSHSSEKGIIFGLGFIAVLIILSVVQLYRSLELTPANSENANLGQLSILNTDRATTKSSSRNHEIL
ncbi:MAG: hypothetical protein QNJ72_18780 [Pleurocapsa sp. MO_226.B13]|nr:hypothetical protein [Pleurocapsa sp. MO_226.B13]